MAQRWAFLVGINRYIDPNFGTLKFCVNDVKAIANILKQVGYEVVCLHDELEPDSHLFPTRDNVEAQLKQLCLRCRQMIYFGCILLVTVPGWKGKLIKRNLF
ncbi:caspase family protein [Calothrix sp. UHCC 0171]|uniref:caspase family protein n=1 Tax=Calothrix sp. UHCC 0171 TaxID=3110245 RepID=UPI002B219728|nr:caspase family protein [Calothrix sp. UHCC 0171]MEA5574264.1 caspase family protein [Calothrix sp. UHCC 0171]